MSSRQELAAAKRIRRAQRGPGFSTYGKGLPSSSDRRARLSNERAEARKKTQEDYESKRTVDELKAERNQRRRHHRFCKTGR